MKERQILTILLIAAILMPVASTFLFLFGRITAMLGDASGSRVLDGAAIIITVLWIVDFVALVFALTVKSLDQAGGLLGPEAGGEEEEVDSC